nr:MAG TPA: Protein of unknown function (DUF3810) [Caudoviricetes sp.]
MDEGQGLINALISGQISFWGVCETLGLCFLCWLVAYLVRCIMRKLPETFPNFLTYAIMMIWGLFGMLGLPVTLCIALKDHFDFEIIRKAAKDEERESAQELIDLYKNEAVRLREQLKR